MTVSPTVNRREAAYTSDTRPDFEPFEDALGEIHGFVAGDDLATLVASGRVAPAMGLELLDDMLAIRGVEEMIVRLRSGGYDPLPGYDYRGPTHVSIGQEASPVGACAALRPDDQVTSSHRGHGDAIAKGFAALRRMPEDELRGRVPWSAAATPAALLSDALEEHLFRVIAELFGKEEGYCRGRGGGMHIGDFATGNLGANAIVGGSVPIATGAAMAARYRGSDRVVCCFAGDGAYANGVVLESLNWAAQAQWTNHLAETPYGLPIIYFIQNNHYGMTHRTDDEVMGVRHLARRGAGFAENNMHAEVVNGMDALAVYQAVERAAAHCRAGDGPVLIEASTYRYYGHSLSDPRNEYRTREEEAAWRAADPIERLKGQIASAGIADAATIAAVEANAVARNERAAVRAAAGTDPDPADLLTYLYTDSTADVVPASEQVVVTNVAPPVAKRADGQITYRDAIREALVEEMLRDRRVLHYGEDVAEYGGCLQADQGTPRGVRPEPRLQHPDLGGLHLRDRRRRGDRRAAARRRADVHGLRPHGRRSARQPGGQVALHERRAGRGPARRPRLRRRRARATAASIRSRSRACSPTLPGCMSCTRPTRPTPRAC